VSTAAVILEDQDGQPPAVTVAPVDDPPVFEEGALVFDAVDVDDEVDPLLGAVVFEAADPPPMGLGTVSGAEAAAFFAAFCPFMYCRKA
jgi:hypothetical protein